MGKTTLILGASTNDNRYSNRAAKMLLAAGHPIIMVGNRSGEINGNPIVTSFPKDVDIHTITLYLGAPRQIAYYDDILQSGAKRIIFNPGTSNPDLRKKAEDRGIYCEDACNLVMLSTGQF
ncbi:MAG: CoA-binding protein [Cryomorphaceae bacterium]|nr:CoA-binding protein [Cryomorphaceae bacterium]